MSPVWQRTAGQWAAQSGPSKVDTSGFPSVTICAGDPLNWLIRSTTWDTGQHPAAMLQTGRVLVTEIKYDVGCELKMEYMEWCSTYSNERNSEKSPVSAAFS